MKKILLIGLTTELQLNIYDTITQDFGVRQCPMNSLNAQGMTKVYKPDLVIICYEDIKTDINDFLVWLNENMAELPVIVATTAQGLELVKDNCAAEHITTMVMPLKGKDVKEQCKKLLGMEDEAGEEGGKHSRSLRKAVGRKVLVVDDSAIAVRGIKSMLGEHYDTIVATSGKEALNLIPKEQPDVILLDIEMPEMDGIETFEHIQKLDVGNDTPVIFLTSVSNRERILSVLRREPAGYVLKPPNSAALFKLIDNLLDNE